MADPCDESAELLAMFMAESIGAGRPPTGRSTNGKTTGASVWALDVYQETHKQAPIKTVPETSGARFAHAVFRPSHIRRGPHDEGTDRSSEERHRVLIPLLKIVLDALGRIGTLRLQTWSGYNPVF